MKKQGSVDRYEAYNFSATVTVQDGKPTEISLWRHNALDHTLKIEPIYKKDIPELLSELSDFLLYLKKELEK